MDCWGERKSGSGKVSDAPNDYLFSIDQSRIVNSIAFRRLQSKTQVHTIGDSEFFRTRLTHSMEVAQIGSSIQNRVNYLSAKDSDQSWVPPLSLIQTICLAHDLGHPAFGHNGEKTLNYFLHNHGGFEGNGQTFRILTVLGEYSKDAGYNLTRRTLLGVLKYPALHKDMQKKYPDCSVERSPDVAKWAPPKCIHDCDYKSLDWVLDPLSNEDRDLFTKVYDVGGKFKTKHKSIDASIMECADDIAYAIHDLEDAIVMNLIDKEFVCTSLKYEFEYLSLLSGKKHKIENKNYISDKIRSDSLEDVKAAVSSMISIFVRSTRIEKNEEFTSPILSHKCCFGSEAEDLINNIKNFVFNNVIATPEVQTLEFKGQKIISDLYSALISKPSFLLPKVVYSKVENFGLERVVADYLSSMTDKESCRLYQRLFTPENGSVFSPLF